MNRLQLVTVAVGLSFIIAALHQAYALFQDINYNQAMQQRNYATASKHRSDYGLYSAAREQQLASAYEHAHNSFASVNLQEYPALRVPVLFYLAENYVQQAVLHEQKGDDEQRIPLLELAKENYRSILVEDPDNWSVRVNLARVLRMLPDARLSESDDDDILPERSPQAPVQAMGYDRLP